MPHRTPPKDEASRSVGMSVYALAGFTTLKSKASRLEVSAVDVTGIEVRLPASPTELCRQR